MRAPPPLSLVLVLLLKFCALLALIEQGHAVMLIIVPLLGRAALLGLFLTIILHRTMAG